MAKFPLGARFRPEHPIVDRLKGSPRGPRTGPTINRGQGNNNASTPWKFIHPVEAKFGKLDWDLAASRTNKKAELFIAEEDDALSLNWSVLRGVDLNVRPLCWLNPPYFNITVWAKKCAEEVQLGARVLLLVPASVGANWFEQWVWPYADVYSVGRMCFDDCYDRNGKLITDDYPKDLLLAHFDASIGTGKQFLFWKEWRRGIVA